MSVMISPSGLATMDATRFDAMGFETSIDLKSIGEAEARVLMSAEHKALGYRPPAGSLAAEAQAAAAKNPTPARRIPEDQLTQAALEDATRIKKEREVNGVDITAVSEAQARQLVSEELKVLGHRPLPDSLTSQAQAAAANNPPAVSQLPSLALQRAALDELATSGGLSINIDLDFIGQAEARRLMSEEHKALGYRPPQGSLAAAAQAAAAKHPHASAGLDPVTLARAALVDAKKIEAKRRSLSASSDTKPELNFDTATTVATSEVHTLKTDEQKTPGFRPLPPDSIAALVQSFVEKRATETTTKEAVANQNEVDGGSRTFGEAGL